MMMNFQRRKMKKKFNRSAIGYIYGFKSGLEEDLAKQLKNAGINPMYEQLKLKYTIPESNHTYTPDYAVCPTIILEGKGYFSPADRKKMILIKAQYPDIDFRFIFSNANQRINKNSKTTYAAWCEKYGFKYAHKRIPEQWLKEIKKLI